MLNNIFILDLVLSLTIVK